MKKNLTLLIGCLFIFLGNITAQQLSFRKDGTFKIVQFTDTHIVSHKSESLEAIKLVEETLDTEKPDLVIFTGDVVTGKPALKGWQMVLEPVAQRGYPFVIALGNHDSEQDLSRKEIADILSSYRMNLNKKKNGVLVDVVLDLKSAQFNNTAALIYCMDSNDYSKIDSVKGYGWFSFNQIEWYREQSMKFTKDNDGRPVPALAFFHIPLPEYKYAYDARKQTIGQRLEAECAPNINPGMLTAMVECGDVMATFVGHDHNNDYVAPLYGIALAYGRFSGGKTTYTSIQNGSRIINLKEGERGFSTYIHLFGGKKIEKANYPNDFK